MNIEIITVFTHEYRSDTCTNCGKVLQSDTKVTVTESKYHGLYKKKYYVCQECGSKMNFDDFIDAVHRGGEDMYGKKLYNEVMDDVFSGKKTPHEATMEILRRSTKYKKMCKSIGMTDEEYEKATNDFENRLKTYSEAKKLEK